MRKLIALILALSASSFAGIPREAYVAYLIQNGKSYDEADGTLSDRSQALLGFDGTDVYVLQWNVAGIPAPAPGDLPTGSALEDIISDAFELKKQADQAAKPLAQKQYENAFFALIEQVYNATGVTNAVTPKLGFPELQGLIEDVQAVNPMAAVNFSIKLLTIDAALKRYNVLWWDDAQVHVIP